MGKDPKFNRGFHVGWEELHRNARDLSWRLTDLPDFKGIIAITRGGLVPAAILARELNIRLIDTICISTYDHQSQRSDPVILKDVHGDGDGWLLVDDLVDTGKTAKVVRERLPKAHFATIYAKPQGKPLVDSFVTEVSQDTWIYFPWDIVPQFIEPIVDVAGRD